MMDRVFSDKQLRLMRMWQEGKLRRLNILEGSVRSGKTWISLVLWAFWVATMPKDGNYLMAAKTLTSLRRNCLDLLQTLVGQSNFTYSIPKKEGRLFGRLIYLEGVNDARAESKIRGMTLTGAYCDELTLFTEDFFAMLLSRLSAPGAKLIATTNPDNPNHWVKAKYIDRQDDIDLLVVKYLIEDNIHLAQDYIDSLKREYTGVYYDRYILGLWTAAEGAIYDMFDPAKHVVPTVGRPYTQYYISVDYGTQNPTVYQLWGQHGDRWYLVKEYYYDGRAAQRQKTDSEYANDMIGFVDGLTYSRIIVDPSAASYIAELKQRGLKVRPANNDVLDGIRHVGSLLRDGKLLINDCALHTIREFAAYTWDAKAADRGEDKPIKDNDHCMDSMRYFAHTALKPGGLTVLK